MSQNQKREITCIICPIGCRITIEPKLGLRWPDIETSFINLDDMYIHSGNKCYKGGQFAVTEMAAPVRTLTTTVRTIFPDKPVLPVKTNNDVPKEKIIKIIRELSGIMITEKIGIGETICANILGTGCDIIASSNLLKE
ncbi:MAG: DUF1667 domain-containing protein [Treponema sp.]|nr:DUF1667 domain-containing protein [Treponema sp.]